MMMWLRVDVVTDASLVAESELMDEPSVYEELESVVDSGRSDDW